MRATQSQVKSEIIRKYLEGYPETEIGKLFNVSVGHVSSIVKEESKKDGYILVIREVVKMFKSNNLEIDDVIAGIRLRNKIKEVGLTISFFEEFIEVTNTESFRVGMDHEKFLDIIKRMLHFEKIFKIKLEATPDFSHNAIKKFVRLNGEISKAEAKLTQLYDNYGVKKSEVERYLKEKSLFEKAKLFAITGPTHSDWMVFSDSNFKKASKLMKAKIDPKILYKKLNSIYKEPDKHIDIVKQIMNSSDISVNVRRFPRF
jgi:hypothetical protein